MRAIAIAICILTVGAADAAQARSGCEARAHERRVAGTVLGAVGGAIIGNQISHSGGTVLGGLAGGFAGNQLSKTHCPHYTSRARYERRPAADRAPGPQEAQAAGRCSMQDQPYYDAHGDLVHRQVQVCR